MGLLTQTEKSSNNGGLKMTNQGCPKAQLLLAKAGLDCSKVLAAPMVPKLNSTTKAAAKVARKWRIGAIR